MFARNERPGTHRRLHCERGTGIEVWLPFPSTTVWPASLMEENPVWKSQNRPGVESDGLFFFDLPAGDYDDLREAMASGAGWSYVQNTASTHSESLAHWLPDFVNWSATLAFAKGSIHLDIGSGSGLLSYLVARRGYHSVAVDLMATDLYGGRVYRDAIQPTSTSSIQLWVADIYDLPLKNASVDFVTIKEVLHHLTHLDDLFREAARVLKPDGRVYLWEPFWPSVPFVRWALVERYLRPKELALGIRHQYYTYRDYKALAAKHFSRCETRIERKRTKLIHRLTQHREMFGRVAIEGLLRKSGDPVRGGAHQRRQIDPADFLHHEFLGLSIEHCRTLKHQVDLAIDVHARQKGTLSHERTAGSTGG
jgi:ubiquinone/menaquinone biosynthesis C-methylase UbiE